METSTFRPPHRWSLPCPGARRTRSGAPTLLGLLLSSLPASAQAPAAAEPVPAVKVRGALWASAAASNRTTADGSLFLRGMDAGDGQLALDGAILGLDAKLADGWSAKVSLLAGQDGKVLNATTLGADGRPYENGSIAWPEAMLVWTGGADTVKVGRMYTPLGMEVLDHTQDVTASRGLLFTYAIPFAQLGIGWHHAFSPSWSSDLWVFNGEDRVQDNNKGKTVGLGVTWNAGGSADDFVALMGFSGPEQDGLGGSANTGAEGRRRNRLSLAGQWIWGKATLQWEGEWAQEAFRALPGAPGVTQAAWYGGGLIFKYQFSDAWAGFARAESLHDAAAVRLGIDATVAGAYPAARDRNLQAASVAVGAERRWHATFSRLEVRYDRLNKDVAEGPGGGGRPFDSAASLTWSVGTAF